MKGNPARTISRKRKGEAEKKRRNVIGPLCKWAKEQNKRRLDSRGQSRDRQAGWLAGWMDGWLTDNQTGRRSSWPAWLAGCQAGRQANRLTDR